jgi:putative DNA primase/helicase
MCRELEGTGVVNDAQCAVAYFGSGERLPMPVTLRVDAGPLRDALRLHALGLNVFPLKEGTKDEPLILWKPYQETRVTVEQVQEWFGNGSRPNTAIPTGPVSRAVVIDTDNYETEDWVAKNLPPTPMITRTARGFHRYYRCPDGDVPAFIYADCGPIEVKRKGHYVLAPGSVHPSGFVYTEMWPWPTSLDQLPALPDRLFKKRAATTHAANDQKPHLPRVIEQGGRNSTLFTEGCRLRRLGFNENEIRAALLAINESRCKPREEDRIVEGIARQCAAYTPAEDTFPLTETGDAEYFAACFGQVLRFDHRRGRWLHFHDHHWRPETDGEVRRLALDAIRGRQRAALDIEDDDRRKGRLGWAIGGEARRRQVNLLALAQNLKPIADDGEHWDEDPWLLGTPNGVVDLRTGQLRDGRPDDRMTMCTAVPFDANAVCPLWDRTISQIFREDQELIDYFDRYVGYSLTGDCREETLAFCWGDGANGKGTLMYTLRYVLGDYADDLPFSALELHDRSGIPNDIAKIVGKRFVTSSETGEVARLNEARVKALTGRDPITARFLHREFFTFQPAAKFWLATNKKPVVRDTSLGFWRRMHLIPFTQTFTADKANQTLKEELRAEAPGILARAVRGCLAWQAKGLRPPASVVEATNSYREQSMPLTRFIEARCVVQAGLTATFTQLHDAYISWCNTTREQSRLNRSEFLDALQQRFKWEKGTRSTTYHGIGLADLLRASEEDGGGIPF